MSSGQAPSLMLDLAASQIRDRRRGAQARSARLAARRPRPGRTSGRIATRAR